MITFREKRARSGAFLQSCNSSLRSALLLCITAGMLSGLYGCQGFKAGSGSDQDCKYSLKKRKSYISCLQAGSGSSVIKPLPLKVSGKSLDGLISSIDLYLGTRYRFGGSDPDGFDCSGFVRYLYEKNFRMLLPRTSGELALLGSMVPKAQLRPGDLVFFSTGRTRIDHAGIFIGKNNFAHASINGVKISSLNEPYYLSHYTCSSRLIAAE